MWPAPGNQKPCEGARTRMDLVSPRPKRKAVAPRKPPEKQPAPRSKRLVAITLNQLNQLFANRYNCGWRVAGLISERIA